MKMEEEGNPLIPIQGTDSSKYNCGSGMVRASNPRRPAIKKMILIVGSRKVFNR